MDPRLDAAKRGEKTYFTGKLCKKGHSGARYVSTGNCIACLNLHCVLRNNALAGNPVVTLPTHADLHAELTDFATLLLRRDPTALLHMRLALSAHPGGVRPLGAK